MNIKINNITYILFQIVKLSKKIKSKKIIFFLAMSTLNKKNLRLKNMINTTRLSKAKIKIPNIISIIATTNNQTNKTNFPEYINKQNKILNNIYQNYSTNKKKKTSNSNNQKSNSVKKHSNKKNLVSFGSTPLITNYTKFTSCLNSMRENSFSQNSSIMKNYTKKHSDKMIRKRNLNHIISNYSCSSKLIYTNKLNESSGKINKFKPILKKDISHKRKNIISHKNNISSENITSTSYIYNNNNTDFFLKKSYNTSKKKKNKPILKYDKSIQLQTKLSTSQSTLNKKKQNSIVSNNENENINLNNIENPEELHFYFVYIFQSRKKVEKKFENNF